MDKLSKCILQPFHRNRITRGEGAGAVYSSSFNCKLTNVTYLILRETLFIIDVKDFDIMASPKCKHCGIRRTSPYLYGEWPDVRATIDGINDLPIMFQMHNIRRECTPHLFNEPSFGEFIYIFIHPGDAENISGGFILYCLPQNIISVPQEDYIIIDGKAVVCCITLDNKIILIDTDGKILDVKIAYPAIDDASLFIIGNGHLKYTEHYNTLEWKYTSRPALNTKSARANFTDE